MAMHRARATQRTIRRRMRGRRRAGGWSGRWVVIVGLLAGVAALWLGACSAGGASNDDDDDDGAGNAGTGGFNLGGQGVGGALEPEVAFFSGKVMGPNGTTPISGALVYAQQGMPDPIPDGVYCERCIELLGKRFVLTDPDGSFTLGVSTLGNHNLIVQKGSFRRVRQVTVTQEGETVPLGPDVTNLPAVSNPSIGDWVPKMAVAYGSYDSIEDSLERLGLQAGVAFDIYEEYGYPPGASLLTDSTLLESYHIVFFPCTDSWPNSYVQQQNVQTNVRNFVNKGGRLYVTDWTYDVVRQIFAPEMPISWLGDDGSPDSAHTGIYDAQSQAIDPGLAAWLSVQGITTFMAEDNWTIINQVNQFQAPDETGASVAHDPTVWVAGDVPGEGNRPVTTSFQYGCGRTMFSTYHTEASFTQLMPQEMALLYIILEIGVCTGEMPPPR